MINYYISGDKLQRRFSNPLGAAADMALANALAGSAAPGGGLGGMGGPPGMLLPLTPPLAEYMYINELTLVCSENSVNSGKIWKYQTMLRKLNHSQEKTLHW